MLINAAMQPNHINLFFFTHRLKWHSSSQELKCKHSDRPAIHLVGVPGLGVHLMVKWMGLDRAIQDLWRKVVDGAQPVPCRSPAYSQPHSQ